MISTFQPDAIIGQEGSPEVAAAFGYILRPTDDRDAFFVTSYHEAFEVSGLPAKFGAAEPQSFTPSQVGHGDIVLSSDFRSQNFAVFLPYNHPLFNPFIFLVPSNSIEITIFRAGADDPTAETLEWGQDTYIVQSGIMEDFGVSGDTISLACVPLPLHTALGLPRVWFSRSCQHALYGSVCQVDRETVKKTGQIDLSACNARRRQISIDGVSGVTDADYFTSGILKHVDSGEEFSIYASEHEAGTVTATLGHWSEQFEDDDEIHLFPGCRRTAADCETKFSNKINFGGFPYLPNRNPSINSA